MSSASLSSHAGSYTHPYQTFEQKNNQASSSQHRDDSAKVKYSSYFLAAWTLATGQKDTRLGTLKGWLANSRHLEGNRQESTGKGGVGSFVFSKTPMGVLEFFDDGTVLINGRGYMPKSIQSTDVKSLAFLESSNSRYSGFSGWTSGANLPFKADIRNKMNGIAASHGGNTKSGPIESMARSALKFPTKAPVVDSNIPSLAELRNRGRLPPKGEYSSPLFSDLTDIESPFGKQIQKLLVSGEAIVNGKRASIREVPPSELERFARFSDGKAPYGLFMVDHETGEMLILIDAERSREWQAATLYEELTHLISHLSYVHEEVGDEGRAALFHRAALAKRSGDSAVLAALPKEISSLSDVELEARAYLFSFAKSSDKVHLRHDNGSTSSIEFKAVVPVPPIDPVTATIAVAVVVSAIIFRDEVFDFIGNIANEIKKFFVNIGKALGNFMKNIFGGGPSCADVPGSMQDFQRKLKKNLRPLYKKLGLTEIIRPLPYAEIVPYENFLKANGINPKDAFKIVSQDEWDNKYKKLEDMYIEMIVGKKTIEDYTPPALDYISFANIKSVLGGEVDKEKLIKKIDEKIEDLKKKLNDFVRASELSIEFFKYVLSKDIQLIYPEYAFVNGPARSPDFLYTCVGDRALDTLQRSMKNTAMSVANIGKIGSLFIDPKSPINLLKNTINKLVDWRNSEQEKQAECNKPYTPLPKIFFKPLPSPPEAPSDLLPTPVTVAEYVEALKNGKTPVLQSADAERMLKNSGLWPQYVTDDPNIANIDKPTMLDEVLDPTQIQRLEKLLNGKYTSSQVDEILGYIKDTNERSFIGKMFPITPWNPPAIIEVVELILQLKKRYEAGVAQNPQYKNPPSFAEYYRAQQETNSSKNDRNCGFENSVNNYANKLLLASVFGGAFIFGSSSVSASDPIASSALKLLGSPVGLAALSRSGAMYVRYLAEKQDKNQLTEDEKKLLTAMALGDWSLGINEFEKVAMTWVMGFVSSPKTLPTKENNLVKNGSFEQATAFGSQSTPTAWKRSGVGGVLRESASSDRVTDGKNSFVLGGWDGPMAMPRFISQDVAVEKGKNYQLKFDAKSSNFLITASTVLRVSIKDKNTGKIIEERDYSFKDTSDMNQFEFDFTSNTDKVVIKFSQVDSSSSAAAGRYDIDIDIDNVRLFESKRKPSFELSSGLTSDIKELVRDVQSFVTKASKYGETFAQAGSIFTADQQQVEKLVVGNVGTLAKNVKLPFVPNFAPRGDHAAIDALLNAGQTNNLWGAKVEIRYAPASELNSKYGDTAALTLEDKSNNKFIIYINQDKSQTTQQQALFEELAHVYYARNSITGENLIDTPPTSLKSVDGNVPTQVLGDLPETISGGDHKTLSRWLGDYKRSSGVNNAIYYSRFSSKAATFDPSLGGGVGGWAFKTQYWGDVVFLADGRVEGKSAPGASVPALPLKNSEESASTAQVKMGQPAQYSATVEAGKEYQFGFELTGDSDKKVTVEATDAAGNLIATWHVEPSGGKLPPASSFKLVAPSDGQITFSIKKHASVSFELAKEPVLGVRNVQLHAVDSLQTQGDEGRRALAIATVEARKAGTDPNSLPFAGFTDAQLQTLIEQSELIEDRTTRKVNGADVYVYGAVGDKTATLGLNIGLKLNFASANPSEERNADGTTHKKALFNWSHTTIALKWKSRAQHTWSNNAPDNFYGNFKLPVTIYTGEFAALNLPECEPLEDTSPQVGLYNMRGWDFDLFGVTTAGTGGASSSVAGPQVTDFFHSVGILGGLSDGGIERKKTEERELIGDIKKWNERKKTLEKYLQDLKFKHQAEITRIDQKLEELRRELRECDNPARKAAIEADIKRLEGEKIRLIALKAGYEKIANERIKGLIEKIASDSKNLASIKNDRENMENFNQKYNEAAKNSKGNGFPIDEISGGHSFAFNPVAMYNQVFSYKTGFPEWDSNHNMVLNAGILGGAISASALSLSSSVASYFGAGGTIREQTSPGFVDVVSVIAAVGQAAGETAAYETAGKNANNRFRDMGASGNVSEPYARSTELIFVGALTSASSKKTFKYAYPKPRAALLPDGAVRTEFTVDDFDLLNTGGSAGFTVAFPAVDVNADFSWS